MPRALISLPQVNPDLAKRFLKRVATSIPARLEGAAADVIDPAGAAIEARQAFEGMWSSYKAGTLGPQILAKMKEAASSPEALADAAVDVAAIAATRKLPFFKSTNVDEGTIAGLASENIPGVGLEKKLKPLGTQLKDAVDRVDARYAQQEQLKRLAQTQAPPKKQGLNKAAGALYGKPK
jgi:hypothetical protein